MSRTGGGTPRGQGQELVYCHECENEWYKTSDNGLTCPTCHSDFTEIIEQDFDPTAAFEPRRPLQSHNPWPDADDPAEDDIDAFDASPYGQSGRTMPGSFQTGNRAGAASPFQNAVMGDFASMIGLIAGLRGISTAFPTTSPDGNTSRAQPTTSTRFNGTTFRQESGPGFRVTFTSGPGFSFTSHTSTTGATSPGTRALGPGGIPMGDIEQLIGNIFGNFGGGRPHQGGGGAQSSFGAMIASMLDPANAAHGDAVFSQEALDRVISQLMDQNPGGSAPGPASEAAITRLPRKKLTTDMLDENTGQAECAICMDAVPVGEEIATLPCSHWFHYDCVEAWLKEHDTCPVCRRGIMPKDGSRDSVRNPQQAPLHDEGPAEQARRQSGTRENPFVVDESPTRERRRRPSNRRYSSTEERGNNGGGGQGISDRVRNFFTGASGGSTSASRRSSSTGRR